MFQRVLNRVTFKFGVCNFLPFLVVSLYGFWQSCGFENQVNKLLFLFSTNDMTDDILNWLFNNEIQRG